MKTQYKIGIDARLAFQTGVGVYIRNLLRELDSIAPDSYQFFVYAMRKDIARLQISTRYQIRPTDARWHGVEEQAGFASQIGKDSLDLMHFTYFSYPVVYRRPFISTVHDMTPILFQTGKASTQSPLIYAAKHLVFRFVFHEQLVHSLRLITPTQTVAKQISDYAPRIVQGKLRPIYEGVDYEIQHTKPNEQLRKTVYKPYFLYSGNCYPHKNVERLVDAFGKVATTHDLILLGPDDFFTRKMQEYVNKLGLQNCVRIIRGTSIADRVFYYRNAYALVHPSRSEGFGLPLVEAMWFGIPILASHIPVFQEILGDTYRSFDPLDTDTIAHAMQYAIAHPQQCDYQKQLKQFSFHTMAQQTLAVYKEAIA